MSVTLVNNSPQLTVATAGTRGLTGAYAVSASFSGSNLIITLSDGTVINAGGAILSSSGSNNWVGQQAIYGNVIVTGSFILSGSNTLVNIGPASFSGSVNISGSTTITGSLIISGGTINVLGTNLISASQGITISNTTGYTTFSSSLSQSISHSVSNLSSSIGSLSGSLTNTINSSISLINQTNSTFVSKSIFNAFTASSNGRVTSLEGESSNVRVTLNSYTQSQQLKNNRYEISQSAALISASLFNDVSASYVISASSLQGSASAHSTRLSIAENILQGLSIISGALHEFSQSVSAVTNSLQIATASLFTSASSLNLTSSNHETRLDAIESDSGSWGTSTNVTALNAFATSSLVSITALQNTASILIAYTTSSDSDINNLEFSASSLTISASSLRTSASTALSTNNSQASSITALNLFSASVNSVTNSLQLTTASLNTFTASVNSTTASLNVINSSLLTSASSLVISASSLTTSASVAKNRLNSIEYTTESLNIYTSSLKNAISVSGSDLTVIGNLTVQGETTTLNSTNLIIEDKLIELARGTTLSIDANGAGIYISGADASVVWNSSQNRIDVNKGINVSGNITLGGTVDGTDVSQLSSSFNLISQSYLIESASVSTSVASLNSYTSSNNSDISTLLAVSTSYSTFTQSYYSASASIDSRLDLLEISVGVSGSGIVTDVNNLILSASSSALINTQQSTQLSILVNGSPTASVNSVIRLASTASNLTAGATAVTTQLNSQTASITVLFQSASSLRLSASNANSNIQSQSTSITSLNNFTQSFASISASVSSSISQISASIGGTGAIGTLINGLTASVANLTVTQSGISSSYNNFSSSYLFVSNSFLSSINILDTQRVSYLDFVSGSRSGSFPSFPPFSSSVEQRFNSILNTINQISNSVVFDSEQVIYSQSVAITTNNLYTESIFLSQSVWSNTFFPSGSLTASVGLSRSIHLAVQNISASLTTRINNIVTGTGFIERPEFNGITSSLYTSTASLNSFSASVRASGSIINTFTSSVNTSTASLNTYTSSLKSAIQANGNNINVSGNLFISGNITAQQYIVSTSVLYVTQSNISGSTMFGNDYGDEHGFSGSIRLFGPLVMRAGLLGPYVQPTFMDISGSITASGNITSDTINAVTITASIFSGSFSGSFSGAFSSSIQTNIVNTTGFNSLISAITTSINDASTSLSASTSLVTLDINNTLNSINSATSSLYNTSQSLNNSTQSLNTFSASVIATGSLMNTFTSSVNSFSESVIATGSLMNIFTASVIATGSLINTFTQSVNTSTSSLNVYTSSLKGAISVTGSNLKLLGNVNVENDLIVSGNIIAQQYIVSSSVTYMTTSFSNGSTIFGNDANDTHQFTGSIYVTNDITASNIRGTIIANNGVVSSSQQFVAYGALLTSSVSGKQAVSGTLIISGTTSITGSTNIDLRGVPSGNFTIQNGATRIDSILFVSDNDYVSNAYVGGDIKINDYIAGGYTAHYDGGVQITGSLRVNAGQNGSGSYFTGSVQITGNEAVSGNLQVIGNTSVSGNFIGTTISASSAITASSLRVEGLTRINGEVDLDTTSITIGAGGNAVSDETRLNTLNFRVDSDTFFNSNVTAISGSMRVKSLAINDLSESRIPFVNSTDTLTDSANFTYNGVVFKVGGGRFEIDDATGNIRTSGSLSVGAISISNNLDVAGAVGLQSTLTVTGSTLISSSLRATSTASFGALTVTGSSVLNGRLQVGTNTAISGNLGVSGAVAISSSLFVSGGITAGANVNISGDVAITGSLNAFGSTISLGNSMTDNIYLSGNLEITGSLTRNATNIKAAFSQISTFTQQQAWSASFVSESTIRTPDEYLEYFVGYGSDKKRYVVPLWLDETLYADDYFDISTISGQDSDYVF